MKKFILNWIQCTIGLLLPCIFMQASSAEQLTIVEANATARPNTPEVITFYALGDWGAGYLKQEPVAIALERNVATIPNGRRTPPFAIELGDNIYPSGLPFQKSLNDLIYAWNNPEVINALENTFGQVYKNTYYNGAPITFHVLPGNHDHEGRKRKKNSTGDILLQETKAENLYAGWWAYYPINHHIAGANDTNDFREYITLRKYADEHGYYGLTLPETLALPPQNTIVCIALDTQIILEMYEEDDEWIEQHWARLEEILKIHAQTPWKIILGHHPIASWGEHGGAEGGMRGLVRYGVGFMQDLDDGDYRKFRKRLASIMKTHNAHLYLSGHEHNLQFITLDTQDTDLLQLDNNYIQIVSGSAGKTDGISSKHKALFAYAEQTGFVRLDATNTELWVEFLTHDPESGDPQSLSTWTITRNP